MKTLILLLAIVSVAVIWYESLRIRERVMAHCGEICERAGLQFLDHIRRLSQIHESQCIVSRERIRAVAVARLTSRKRPSRSHK